VAQIFRIFNDSLKEDKNCAQMTHSLPKHSELFGSNQLLKTLVKTQWE